MLNRRIRTLIDEHLASGYFHNRIDELVTQIARDALLDKARWGGSTHFPGTVYTLQAANDRIVIQYLAPRVPYLTIHSPYATVQRFAAKSRRRIVDRRITLVPERCQGCGGTW